MECNSDWKSWKFKVIAVGAAETYSVKYSVKYSLSVNIYLDAKVYLEKANIQNVAAVVVVQMQALDNFRTFSQMKLLISSIASEPL
ncbi:Hypothetical predicted protein [Octopus vulgaris]|uniref:Uncharacterized protein n=1 Tax=Octopus vulgaris TaxID=6645 RepID=A0AA36BC80_OCTVU|nr:Hypothetical predicted protein [Octopus vulgaris]